MQSTYSRWANAVPSKLFINIGNALADWLTMRRTTTSSPETPNDWFFIQIDDSPVQCAACMCVWVWKGCSDAAASGAFPLNLYARLLCNRRWFIITKTMCDATSFVYAVTRSFKRARHSQLPPHTHASQLRDKRRVRAKWKMQCGDRLLLLLLLLLCARLRQSQLIVDGISLTLLFIINSSRGDFSENAKLWIRARARTLA